MSIHVDTAREALDHAEQHIKRIGGFNGNGADELAPVATAEALIGIGHALLDIGLWLQELNETTRQGLA